MLEVKGKMIAKGARVGMETTWELAKILVPTAMVVTVFKASGLLDVLLTFCPLYGALWFIWPSCHRFVQRLSGKSLCSGGQHCGPELAVKGNRDSSGHAYFLPFPFG